MKSFGSGSDESIRDVAIVEHGLDRSDERVDISGLGLLGGVVEYFGERTRASGDDGNPGWLCRQ